MERAAVGVLQMSDPTIRSKHGARQALRDATCDEDFKETIEASGRIMPDAWSLSEPVGGCRTFRWIEIEDTSKLTPEKVAWLSNVWADADCTMDLEFEVWVCDRYGHSLRQIDLMAYWYEPNGNDYVQDAGNDMSTHDLTQEEKDRRHKIVRNMAELAGVGFEITTSGVYPDRVSGLNEDHLYRLMEAAAQAVRDAGGYSHVFHSDDPTGTNGVTA